MIKLPKGTQDYRDIEYDKLQYLKNEITNIFLKYNGNFVETPVFELRNVLMGKYGEEEKLIYNIESMNTLPNINQDKNPNKIPDKDTNTDKDKEKEQKPEPVKEQRPEIEHQSESDSESESESESVSEAESVVYADTEKETETETETEAEAQTEAIDEKEKTIYEPCKQNPIKTKIKNNVEEQDFRETLSLRYDHTIPLVRHCISNKINKMRRACIGKVYRKETTTKSQIRLREFYQADFDYVGNFDTFVPELEIFCMIQELFENLGINNYEILYNYRQNLDHWIKNSLIDPSKIATVCSSIDKLDKKDPEEIRKELLLKGCTNTQIDSLLKFILLEPVMEPSIVQLDKQFCEYIQQLGILDITKIKFAPQLARGLDYYTGIIFEVKLTASTINSSVAAGGRYDDLMDSYIKKSKLEKKKGKTPMIGLCFGMDRILPFVTLPKHNNPRIKIWVSTIGEFDNPREIKLNIIGRLRKRGYIVYYNLSDRKFKKEISDASENECNYVIIIGNVEWSNDTVTVKNMKTGKQFVVPFNELDNFFSHY